jgi:hypothetical protein
MLWVVTLSGFLPSFTSSAVDWVETGPPHRLIAIAHRHSFLI